MLFADAVIAGADDWLEAMHERDFEAADDALFTIVTVAVVLKTQRAGRSHQSIAFAERWGNYVTGKGPLPRAPGRVIRFPR